MNSLSLTELIASDLARYVETFQLRGQKYSKTKVFWESLIFKAGFQAVLLYRISHWCFQKGWHYTAWFLARLNIFLTGAEIEYNAQIGPGFLIAHPVGIVIGRGTVMGEHVTLFQGTSFAVKSWHPDEIKRFPKIGNHCFVFANAAVLGGITVGDYCIVGANSVLTKDLPDGALAKGVPAEIVPEQGRKNILSWIGTGIVDPVPSEVR